MGALPPTPRSFPHWANGLLAKSVAARGKPCRNTEVSAPLATSTAPVALRQSRILRTMADSHLKSPQHQSFRVRSCRNPVLRRLRCLVLNRLCLVLLRPQHSSNPRLHFLPMLDSPFQPVTERLRKDSCAYERNGFFVLKASEVPRRLHSLSQENLKNAEKKAGESRLTMALKRKRRTQAALCELMPIRIF